MILTDENESIVCGNVTLDKRSKDYKIVLSKNGKAAFINDCVVTKFSEYIGNVNVVCFSPDDVSLFKESPSIRRSFLDKELSSLFPIYLKHLILIKKFLEERNSLLKGNVDMSLLEVLDDKIIETSYEIFKRRKWLISKIEEFATNIYKQLTNESQQIRISYQTFLDEVDQNEYLMKAKKMYQKAFVKDKEKSYTTIGIHKDDFN